MRHERQVDVLRQVAAAGPNLIGLLGPTSMVNPASHYTDESHFAEERRVLFRGRPLYIGLSCEIPDAGSYLTTVVDGVPVAVVRQRDGRAHGMVNACRHRGAPLLAGRGVGLRRLQCPYHAWTYDLDGRLHSRPHSDGAFNDVELECNLHPIEVGEKYGLLFVRLGSGPVDVDAALEGAADDLSAFGLDHYTHIETRTTTWKMNWKLILDTFTESYHIRTLHRETIASTFLSDPSVFEGLGLNFLSIGLRKTVFDELSKPEKDWSILPYGTLQYFLVPTGLVVHQLDHVETWRITPIDVRTTEVSTGVFAPEPPADERTLRYWIKNLDLLLRVTSEEDFPLMEKIQAALDSGALPEVVYGRNEPALVHFHSAIEAALMAPTTP